jgi:AP-1 complex subunit gamma-1
MSRSNVTDSNNNNNNSNNAIQNLAKKATQKIKDVLNSQALKQEQQEQENSNNSNNSNNNNNGKRSLAHKCQKLKEFVKQVRECKTIAEERALVARESAAIRDAFADLRMSHFRHRNVAKLMFMHMLGYATHFGQMECVQLTAMRDFANKRLGYLGLMVLMDENSEVTMLVTNSVKTDLSNKNFYVVGLGLCALGNICTAEMARDVSGEVKRLMVSKNSYIRKKAALCAIRVAKKVPELAESFLEPCERLLNDRHHGVLLAAVTLAYRLCEGPSASLNEDVSKDDFDEEAADNAVIAFRKKVPSLCKVLKTLNSQQKKSGGGGASSASNSNNNNNHNEHDVGGHSDPFLQVHILKLLKVLGRGDCETSDEMSDTLAHVASNTEFSSKNYAGAAILLECVECIVETESVGGLRVLAVNILGKFLASKENNAKYVALTALSAVVKIDQGAVQRHRKTIVECVKDSDISIRKSALNLVYNLVNDSNVKSLVPELLEYLKVADKEFKRDLTKRILVLIAKFAPDERWRCELTVETFRKAGEHIDDIDQRSFCGVVSRGNENLQALVGRSMFKACVDLGNSASQQLRTATCWICGEFADCIAHVPTLENEEKSTTTIADIVSMLKVFLKDENESKDTKRYALTALAKVTARDQSQARSALEVMKPLQASLDLETQSRACEYSAVIEAGPEILAVTMERMPPPEAPKFVELGKKRGKKSLSSAKSNTTKVNTSESATLGDLLDFGGDEDTQNQQGSVKVAVASKPATNVLDDLFAEQRAPRALVQQQQQRVPHHHSPQLSLDDLLGGGDLSAPSSASKQSQPIQSSVDPLADLFSDISVTTTPVRNLGHQSQLFAATPTSATGLLDAFDSVTPVATTTVALSTKPTVVTPIVSAPLDDMFAGLSMDSANVTAVAAPPSPPKTEPTSCKFTALSSPPLTIVFECTKDDIINDPSRTTILVIVTSASSITNLAIQSAVPKSMTVSLEPASGNVLSGSSEEAITQTMRVINSLHGEKALAMKLRISYAMNGEEHVELATISGFPQKF